MILTDKTAQGHLTVITIDGNQTYGIDVILMLVDDNSWKINKWISP